jgi:hypothetical protein
MQNPLFAPRFLSSVWVKPACVILVVAGALILFAREQAKSLFGFDCSKLEAVTDRWKEAGCPSGTNFNKFVEKYDDILASTQTFLVGTQELQARFTLRNPRVAWKGGQLFVTTNKVLILHTETENHIVHR